jgi:release factor glutamine methyltransferase
MKNGVDIRSSLDAAAQRIGRLEARLLLQQASGLSASTLLAYPERLLDAATQAAYLELVERRAAGEPIAYLVGWREFYGRDFRTTPEVLIPRPETELLVELGLARLADIPAPRILDLGCGSGCIGITLALECPSAQVTAIDRSPGALALARQNAAGLGAALHWIESDWCAALAADQRFHLIVSNPPYIRADDPHLAQGDLRFEPSSALASGVDGLDAIRRIVSEARTHLLPGGWLLIEHGYDQAAAVAALLVAGGYEAVDAQRDLAGIVRVSGGRMK